MTVLFSISTVRSFSILKSRSRRGIPCRSACAAILSIRKRWTNHVHGRNGKSIFEYLLGREIDLVEERRLVEQKEQIYRALCLEDDVNFHLAPGVHELLDFITEHHIPTTIATASGRTNLDFFIRQFRLDRWFKPERIVYDDRDAQRPSPIPISTCVPRSGSEWYPSFAW